MERVSTQQVREYLTDDKIKLVLTTLDEPSFINEISSLLGIHHLLIEDIFATNHIPKVEFFDDYIFLILKYLEFNTYEDIFEIRQVSLVLKNNIVIAFLEGPKNQVIEEIKKRLRELIGNLRIQKADFLFYRIIDLTVDQYLSALNYFRARIDDFEELTVTGETNNISHEIVEIKRQINKLRRISSPLKEEIIRIKNFNSNLIRKPVLTYFQDVLDHLNNSIAALDHFSEILTDFMELHFAHMSANMNQVMKTLAIVTTIFIPLTFIAGIYGMNFDSMPEVRWKWGYLMFWCVITVIAVIMILYIRKRKWF
jgi:magnesium transporter